MSYCRTAASVLAGLTHIAVSVKHFFLVLDAFLGFALCVNPSMGGSQLVFLRACQPAYCSRTTTTTRQPPADIGALELFEQLVSTVPGIKDVCLQCKLAGNGLPPPPALWIAFERLLSLGLGG